MNILHYSLGFPPYRSGGLTKFCIDLASQQIDEGNAVSMLWAGEIKKPGGATGIWKCRPEDGIDSYQVINPNPVPYDEGILDTDEFMREGDEKAYSEFLKQLKPDIIHIHTLMGLHKAFLEAAKEAGIRIVFSAHDFFPVCPKVTLFKNGRPCESASSCAECESCNRTALSLTKIRLLQSGLYRNLKDSSVVKLLRRRHRNAYLGEDNDTPVDAAVTEQPEKYIVLRRYYEKLVNYADSIHFNSTLTKEVYERYLNLEARYTGVLPISHRQIVDNRKKREYGDTLRITYMGAESRAKGYYMLREALDRVAAEKKICLNVLFTPHKSAGYINTFDFSYNRLGELFDNTDILAAPSLLYETFGFTVLEALSYGVPVLISSNVGAKDIVPEGCGITLENTGPEALAETILKLDKTVLGGMNERIIKDFRVNTMEEMSRRLDEEFYRR